MQKPIEHERLVYTPAEAAEVLGISTSSMYHYMRQEGFPSLKVGKQWRVSKAGLDKWVLEQAGVTI